MEGDHPRTAPGADPAALPLRRLPAARLQASLAAVRKTLPELRQSILDRETTVFGKPSSTRGYYILLNENLAIQLGRLIVYASLNGLTPP